MAIAPMTDGMYAMFSAEIRRICHEADNQVRTAAHTNRGATVVIPTQTISRNFRVLDKAGNNRAWTVAVSVTEIAAASVAGTTVASTDDFAL